MRSFLLLFMPLVVGSDVLAIVQHLRQGTQCGQSPRNVERSEAAGWHDCSVRKDAVQHFPCGKGVVKDRPLKLAERKKRKSGRSGASNWPRPWLPQALAAQRLHGQMAGPNSRAAGAESSRSIVPASVVRVDVPAGSIAHAHAPQSDSTAHSACAALTALCPTDGWTAISTLNASHLQDRFTRGL